jgi:Zn-dependent protease
MPETHPRLTRIEYWVMGILGAIILFVSVLLHELAHYTLSLRYGLKVRQIMLFFWEFQILSTHIEDILYDNCGR